MQSATFPGRFESLAKISAFVVQAAREAGLDGDAVYGVELAVDEACSNIIEHAYGGEDVGNIECVCEVTNEGLTIILRDWGKPFDPDEVPDPNTSTPLMERKPRGLGLFFMAKMMDEVNFEFTADGNVLTLLKRK